jgi:hypothetical protein
MNTSEGSLAALDVVAQRDGGCFRNVAAAANRLIGIRETFVPRETSQEASEKQRSRKSSSLC